MIIRLAKEEDCKFIAELYDIARLFMINHNNPTQWTKNYPNEKTIKEDTDRNDLYVVEHNGIIVGTFCFYIRSEMDYNAIYDGEWLNNSPYGVIHRIASNGKVKGLCKFIFDWCFTKIDNIRMDTHEDNYVMQNCIKKYGFKNTGIVYIADDDNKPYLAYQMEKKSDS